jgi:hypothetical protein
MSMCKCPKCGTVFHLSDGDSERWKKYCEDNLPPFDPKKEFVPQLCFICWKKDNQEH